MTHKQTHHHRRRRPSVCHRHPSAKPTTGFCAACLRERLATIEAQSPYPSSSSATAAATVFRRTRSYSARDASAAVFEHPRRRSCDVKSSHSSLHHLFAVDDEKRVGKATRMSRVPDLKEEEEEDDDEEEDEEENKGFDDWEERKFVDKDSDDGGGEYKTMKEFIDLEWGNQTKKDNGRDLKQIASVLGKKLRKLSSKHRKKNKKKGEILDARFAENGEIHMTARSEIEDCGIGRRSCDIDTRVSPEAGRASFEEPRASWDGCLMSKTYPKLTPLASGTEDAKASSENIGGDKDEEKNPGGSAQTREYYSDSRRRRSFDRSSSVKRPGSLEFDELKAISNTKVSPETVGLFHGAKLLVTEKELRDSNWYSIKNYKPDSMECGSKGVDCVDGEVKQDDFELKKPRMKWPKNWSIWGLIQRKNEAKQEVKAEKSLKLDGNVIEGSLAESLLNLRRVAKGEANGDVSQKLIRSYSVSTRKSCDGVFPGAAAINGFEGGRSSCDGLFHGSITGVEGGRSSCDGFFHGIEGKGCGEKSKESHLFQRNSIMNTNTNTGMYSPNNFENGLLRFYLTPVRSHKVSKYGKSRLMNSSSIIGRAV